MHERTMDEIIGGRQALAMRPDATVAAACAAMHRQRAGAVLVTDAEGRLAGIFTGRDAVRCLAQGCDARHTRLRQVMTTNRAALAPEHLAIEALRLLDDGGFRHLAVCRGGKAVGLVSRDDFRAREQARLDDETGFFEMLR